MKIFPRDQRQAAACSASPSDVPPSFHACMNAFMRMRALSSGFPLLVPPPRKIVLTSVAICDTSPPDAVAGCTSGVADGLLSMLPGDEGFAEGVSIAAGSAGGLSEKCFFAHTNATIMKTNPRICRKSFKVSLDRFSLARRRLFARWHGLHASSGRTRDVVFASGDIVPRDRDRWNDRHCR